MNKSDLADAIATDAGTSKSEAEKFLASFVKVITDTLVSGNDVAITGFGNYSVSHRAARTGVNPQNPSQKIQIAATKVPMFKAGKGLKDAVKAS